MELDHASRIPEDALIKLACIEQAVIEILLLRRALRDCRQARRYIAIGTHQRPGALQVRVLPQSSVGGPTVTR